MKISEMDFFFSTGRQTESRRTQIIKTKISLTLTLPLPLTLTLTPTLTLTLTLLKQNVCVVCKQLLMCKKCSIWLLREGQEASVVTQSKQPLRASITQG